VGGHTGSLAQVKCLASRTRHCFLFPDGIFTSLQVGPFGPGLPGNALAGVRSSTESPSRDLSRIGALLPSESPLLYAERHWMRSDPLPDPGHWPSEAWQPGKYIHVRTIEHHVNTPACMQYLSTDGWHTTMKDGIVSQH
jgi:hypothetical protein